MHSALAATSHTSTSSCQPSGLNPHNDHDNDDDGVGCVDHYDDDSDCCDDDDVMIPQGPALSPIPLNPHPCAFSEDLVCKGAYSSYACLPPFVLAFNHLK